MSQIPCEHNDTCAHLQSLRNPCDCGASNKTNSSCDGKCGKCIPSGITTAVIDDASEITYFYGNIQHENYHVPSASCLPYFVVPTTVETYRKIKPSTEVFNGTFPLNTIQLAKTPTDVRHMLVFLNGVHQDVGQELDYTLVGDKISFTEHVLIPTDRVSVKYYYKEV